MYELLMLVSLKGIGYCYKDAIQTTLLKCILLLGLYFQLIRADITYYVNKRGHVVMCSIFPSLLFTLDYTKLIRLSVYRIFPIYVPLETYKPNLLKKQV